MKCSRLGLRCTAVAASGLVAMATALTASIPAGAQVATAPGPVIKLVAAQNKITVGSFQGQVFLDPGIYVASLKSALVFHVQRRSYTKPITISQIINLPGGRTRSRPLPGSVLSGFDGLRDFVRLRVSTPGGKTVATQRVMFCPASFDPQRVSPNSPANSPYPQQCNSGDPFALGSVWAVAKGWAVDPFQNGTGSSLQLANGTYQVTATIMPRYVRLLHVAASDAAATVTVKVVPDTGCCGPGPAHSGRPVTRGTPLPSAPAVPYLRNPPRSALPDLVSLPSWGITTSRIRGTKKRPPSDRLNFGATVWIGGTSPLDVEGFRSHGGRIMKAYQYFSLNGRIIGRARAGTMGFDNRFGHNHWHFEQFARYRLLNSARTQAVQSHKQRGSSRSPDSAATAACRPRCGFGR
jgi:hypothetical protein